jgi:hypothetical protein
MPAGNTYEAIFTETLASAQASVTFSSIPSTYTDLVLVSNLYGSGGSANILVRFNSDTGTNYSNTMLTGNGTSAASSRNTSTDSIFMINSGSSLNGAWGTFIMNLNNYSNATTNKTALVRFSAAGNEVTANVGLWRNTSAITAIEIRTSSNNYLAGSTFSLYGIKAA